MDRKGATLRFLEGEIETGEAAILRWDSGRTQKLNAAYLRSLCPCEQCRLASVELKAEMFPGLRLEKAVAVGRYALQMAFSDGHAYGAYTFDFLLSLPDEA